MEARGCETFMASENQPIVSRVKQKQPVNHDQLGPGSPKVQQNIERMPPVKRKKVEPEVEPFYLVYEKHGWDQERMVYEIWKMEPGIKRDDLKEKYDRIYGEDTKCLGWNCIDDLPSELELNPRNYAPEKKSDLRRNIRAQLLYGILQFISSNLLGYSTFKRAMERLYEPTREFRGMEKVAFFRQEVVWPMFGSTKAFCEFLLKFSEDIKGWFLSS